LAPIHNPQSPIPNPQSPFKEQCSKIIHILFKNILNSYLLFKK